MLLLAIDTSGKFGSIALVRCEAAAESQAARCGTIEVVALEGGTFSAQLVPQVAALLQKHNFSKNDIDAFAVASGPGSFTGLRVGLAAVKALAEILGKPIATVSLLEAVAVAGGIQGKVLAALDAGRGEIYAGEYEVASQATLVSERLLSREEFLPLAAKIAVVTPDSVIADLARATGIPVKQIDRPRSDAIAQLGWHKLQSGQSVSAHDLDANYIRRSDAEIMSKNSL